LGDTAEGIERRKRGEVVGFMQEVSSKSKDGWGGALGEGAEVLGG